MAQDSLLFTSKFATTYTKLFEGLAPEQISPKDAPEVFWSNLLALDVNVEFLSNQIIKLSKEECVESLKPVFNVLFSTCLTHARTAAYDDHRKSHAVVTLSVICRCVLQKNLAGFEVMEVFAGSVSKSDHTFMELIAMIDDILGDSNAPAQLRHEILQLAVVFVCGIGQLSPGAYFLRRDLFSAIVKIIRSPETSQFAFEAALLLGLLANFHKTDAANIYLKHISETNDDKLMRTICWAANFAAEAAIGAYQKLSDDSPPTVATNFVSMMSFFRPDLVLTDPPRDLFKSQPIEAAVILLPIYEFLNSNVSFSSIMIEPLISQTKNGGALPLTIITLASYILTHATSSSSSRALSYANLSLSVLLKLVENSDALGVLCEPYSRDIRLCRQRIPHLPYAPSRPPACAILDCCVLFFRHNLHKKLDVYCYLLSVRVSYQLIWFFQKEKIRLDYRWVEFWRAALGVLKFLSKQLGNLNTTSGVSALAQEIISLLDLSINKAEIFLPTPKALHEFIYELVRSSEVINSQGSLIHSLATTEPSQGRASFTGRAVNDSLTSLLMVTQHYGQKIGNVKSAKEAMKTVAQEVDKDGLIGVKSDVQDVLYRPKQIDDVVGLIRYAYSDVMSLMP